MGNVTDYAGLSYWHSSLPDAWSVQQRLDGDLDVDVAIVGGGYTGLWTAYYLLRERPDLRVAVLERHVVGFGASGRNGGWASAIFPASLRCMARNSSREDARAMQFAMNATVQEMADVIAAEGIDCDWAYNGYVSLARNAAQVHHGKGDIATWRSWDFGDEQIRWLEPDEATAMVAATNVLGGTFTPHCAVVHPAKLVTGLGRAVRAKGAQIYEDTNVTAIAPGVVTTTRGMVRAKHIIRATEGYTASLPGLRRSLVPMYSLMVATEQLTPEQLASLGMSERRSFTDKRQLRIYGQLTADNRIAFGGRGAPYHFASRIEPEFDLDARVHDMLEHILVDLFPGLAGIGFTHRWGGALGIPRDWYPSANYDAATGIGAAGGYVGDGVATSNLAGRTLADYVLGRSSALTRLPWAGRTSKHWEPEPLRWLGVNAVTQLFALADRREARTGHEFKPASMFWKAIGH